MQPVGQREAEPSMAIPAVHIAPLGTNARMPAWWMDWVAGWLIVLTTWRCAAAKVHVCMTNQ